jgi:hypothetical protein
MIIDVETPTPPVPRKYATPADGLTPLRDAHFYWTSKITDLSFQSCIGLIAANWAVYSKPGDLVEHSWSLVSVTVALLAVLMSLASASWLASLHFNQFYAAQDNPEVWKKSWEIAEKTPNEWPFTEEIVAVGKWSSLVKVCLPILSGICFAIGVWSN